MREFDVVSNLLLQRNVIYVNTRAEKNFSDEMKYWNVFYFILLHCYYSQVDIKMKEFTDQAEELMHVKQKELLGEKSW